MTSPTPWPPRRWRGRLGAPILLTGRDELPEPTTEALVALGVEAVTLLGGPAAIGPDGAETVVLARVGDIDDDHLAAADRAPLHLSGRLSVALCMPSALRFARRVSWRWCSGRFPQADGI